MKCCEWLDACGAVRGRLSIHGKMSCSSRVETLSAWDLALSGIMRSNHCLATASKLLTARSGLAASTDFLYSPMVGSLRGSSRFFLARLSADFRVLPEREPFLLPSNRYFNRNSFDPPAAISGNSSPAT